MLRRGECDINLSYNVNVGEGVQIVMALLIVLKSVGNRALSNI